MRWPWQREKRDSGGDFADSVLRLIEAQAAGTAADASSTAAIEAASGALSRAFASAEVLAAPWAAETVSPGFLGQVGRDLIRNGDSMHVIRMSGGMVKLIPASSWHWEGSHDPASWTVRVTAYGPSTSTTWNLPASSVVFVRWGSTPGQTYTGTGPTSWAHTTARLQSEAERSLADEAQGPIAQLLSVPADGGDGDDDDPLASLKADLAGARGKAMLVETTSAGWGEGSQGAPRKDWMASRLGPMPPESMVALSAAAFSRMLSACGMPPQLHDPASPATALKESLRVWHLGTVEPLAHLLEVELTEKLATPVRLRFDSYARDQVARSTVFAKLIAAEGVSLAKALELSGLMDADD